MQNIIIIIGIFLLTLWIQTKYYPQKSNTYNTYNTYKFPALFSAIGGLIVILNDENSRSLAFTTNCMKMPYIIEKIPDIVVPDVVKKISLPLDDIYTNLPKF
jgi:hypothetical protein